MDGAEDTELGKKLVYMSNLLCNLQEEDDYCQCHGGGNEHELVGSQIVQRFGALEMMQHGHAVAEVTDEGGRRISEGRGYLYLKRQAFWDLNCLRFIYVQEFYIATSWKKYVTITHLDQTRFLIISETRPVNFWTIWYHVFHVTQTVQQPMFFT